MWLRILQEKKKKKHPLLSHLLHGFWLVLRTNPLPFSSPPLQSVFLFLHVRHFGAFTNQLVYFSFPIILLTKVALMKADLQGRKFCLIQSLVSQPTPPPPPICICSTSALPSLFQHRFHTFCHKMTAWFTIHPPAIKDGQSLIEIQASPSCIGFYGARVLISCHLFFVF